MKRTPHHDTPIPAPVVTPFGHMASPQGVRFIKPHELARANGDPVDLIEQLREREREGVPYDEDEGLAGFLRGGREWLSGFGFGAVAGSLFTVIAAYCWSFYL